MKTQEELNELKQDILNFKDKIADLSEDELKEISGAGKDITIKPSDDMWIPFNPNFIDNNHGLDLFDLLNKTVRDVKIEHVEVKGSISNRDDESK